MERRAGLFAVILAAGLLAPASPDAETLVAARTLRAETLVGHQDLRLLKDTTPGALSDPRDAVGLETRRNIYAGQALRASDLGPPAIVLRNDVVVLSYFRGGLAIETEGRALGRAGIGDRVRVMNLSSRSSVTGIVLADGTVEVTGPSSR